MTSLRPNVRYWTPGSPVVELNVPDPWAALAHLDVVYPPKPDPERDARFDRIMLERREEERKAKRREAA